MDGKIVNFIPQQAEDYCFARAFGFIDAIQGEQRWPQLHNHESDRIVEMERALAESETGFVTSDDHRVVQAIAMRCACLHKHMRFSNPKAVNKSWPEFWRFLNEVI